MKGFKAKGKNIYNFEKFWGQKWKFDILLLVCFGGGKPQANKKIVFKSFLYWNYHFLSLSQKQTLPSIPACSNLFLSFSLFIQFSLAIWFGLRSIKWFNHFILIKRNPFQTVIFVKTGSKWKTGNIVATI